MLYSLLCSLILVAFAEAQSTPVDGCLDTASVDNFVPSDGLQFNTASTPYNLRLHPVPAVVAYPDNSAEVSFLMQTGPPRFRSNSWSGSRLDCMRFPT